MEFNASVSLLKKASQNGNEYKVIRLTLRSGYTIDIVNFDAVKDIENLFELQKLYNIKL